MEKTRGEDFKAAFNGKFLNRERKANTPTEHKPRACLPLAFGLVPEDMKAKDFREARRQH